MSRKVRLLSALSVVALLLASCGGGDSSGRTKNSALCYIDQAEKDAAVQRAQEAFDAAMSGAPAEETPEETPTTIGEESPTTIEEDVPVITDDSSPELEETFGGGYRRPAVRAASSGDTTVPPAEDGGEVVLTPEQQQAQMDLEAAEAQPLCEAEGAESASEVTCTATATIDSSVSDDCADGDVRLDWGGSWTLVNTAEDGTETVLTQGIWDVAALSADNPIVIPVSYSVSYGGGEEESSTDNCSAIFTTTGVSWNCPNGELVQSSFDDSFDDNSWLAKSCSSEGFWNTAEGQEFYFSIFHHADKERFLAGLNTNSS